MHIPETHFALKGRKDIHGRPSLYPLSSLCVFTYLIIITCEVLLEPPFYRRGSGMERLPNAPEGRGGM